MTRPAAKSDRNWRFPQKKYQLKKLLITGPNDKVYRRGGEKVDMLMSNWPPAFCVDGERFAGFSVA
jgi:hypothetical protein